MISIPSDKNILGLSSSLAGELVYRLCVAECARIGFKLAEIDRLESTKAQGDLYIRIITEVPVSLSKRQKELLDEFKLLEEEKPNPVIKSFFEKAKKFWGSN